MLLTRIPHFRDLMVASFECPHCNTRYDSFEAMIAWLYSICPEYQKMCKVFVVAHKDYQPCVV